MEIKELTNQLKREYGENIIPLNKSNPPYVKVKRGFGYEGVLLWDSVGDRIQCHLCGKWLKQIGGLHLHQSHNELTASEYKESFGLNRGQSLTTESRSRQLAQMTADSYANNSINAEQMRKLGLKNIKRYNKMIKGKKSKLNTRYQRRNTHNTCDAQLEYRFKQLQEKLRRIPKQKECPFFSTLVRRYGSWNNALRFFANTINRENQIWDKNKITKALRDYRKIYGYIPTAKELRNKKFYLNPDACYRHFGKGGFSKALKSAFNE